MNDRDAILRRFSRAIPALRQAECVLSSRGPLSGVLAHAAQAVADDADEAERLDTLPPDRIDTLRGEAALLALLSRKAIMGDRPRMAVKTVAETVRAAVGLRGRRGDRRSVTPHAFCRGPLGDPPADPLP